MTTESKYHYAPKYRPPDGGNAPAGWVVIERGRHFNPSLPNVPMGDRRYGVIGYEKPLRPEQIEHFELEPV